MLGAYSGKSIQMPWKRLTKRYLLDILNPSRCLLKHICGKVGSERKRVVPEEDSKDF